jgi:hypothetical protein
MGWFLAAVLILFYLLGLYVFHASRSIHILPIIAVVVLVIDFVATRRFRKTR